jgi:Amt family ammonium transporter
VKKKWALNSAVMCFYAFSIVLVVWSLWGYNMSFGSPRIWGRESSRQTSAFRIPAIGAEGELGQPTIPLAGSGFPPLRIPGSR